MIVTATYEEDPHGKPPKGNISPQPPEDYALEDDMTPWKEGYQPTSMDQVWRGWMDAILMYGPTSDEAKIMETKYCRWYLEVHGRLP